jgi:hypothetical protein
VISQHKLIIDFALLLGALLRIEHFDFLAITNFLSRYKEYSGQLNTMLRSILSEDLSNEVGGVVVKRLDLV